MNIPGYSTLSNQEKEVLHALLDRDGIKVKPADIVDAASDAVTVNWCKVLCAVKAGVAIAACGWNPACIAGAIAAGLQCAAACK
jgi:hypothetical protein